MIFVCICIGCVKIQWEMKGLLWAMRVFGCSRLELVYIGVIGLQIRMS